MGKSVELFIGDKKIATKSLSYEVKPIEKPKLKATYYLNRKGKYYFRTAFGVITISDVPELSELKYGDVVEFDC